MVKNLFRVICVILLFSFVYFPVSANANNSEIANSIDSLFKYLDKNVDKTKANNMADWYYLCSARTGKEKDYSTYAKKLEKTNYINATDYQRVALCLSSMGKDPQKFNNTNLLKSGIFNSNDIKNQGVNAIAYGLLAIDCKNYKTPKEAKYNLEKLIKLLLTFQNSDGGFSLNGGASEIDSTAFALQALAPYKSAQKQKEKALKYLLKMQNNKGGFDSSESVSQVIIALCECRINLNKEFVKNGNTLISNLMSFKNKDGGFKHILEQNKSDNLASTQALCALISYYRYKNSQKAFYDFSDGVKKIIKDEQQFQNRSYIYIIVFACGVASIVIILKKGVVKKWA